MLDFPSSPNVNIGDRFPDPPIAGVPVWTWDGQTWRRGGGGAAGGAGVSVGEFPPANPKNGDLWFDAVEGQLYIWFQNAWVVTINQGGGGGGNGGSTGGGTGVTDGSDAALGEIGEFRQVQGTTTPTYADGNTPEQNAALSLTLSPGDWDVSANCYLMAGPAVNTGALVWLQAGSVTTPPVSFVGYGSGAHRQGGGALPPTRFNLTATTSVLLIVRVVSSGFGDANEISNSGLAQFVLRARRMR